MDQQDQDHTSTMPPSLPVSPANTDNSVGTEATTTKEEEPRSFLRDQEIITVIINGRDDSRRFSVHKNLLTNQSESFRAFFEDETEDETNEDKELIVELRPEDFDAFLKWLYTGRLNLSEVEHNRRHDTTGERLQYDDDELQICNMDRLVDLYIFASWYHLHAFKLAVMLEFQRLLIPADSLLLPIVTVKFALDNLGLESPLCQLFVQCFGHSMDLMAGDKEERQAELATLPSEFLAAMMMAVSDSRERRNQYPRHELYWCDYHEHETAESRKACQESRRDDFDIKKLRQHDRALLSLVRERQLVRGRQGST